MLTSPFDEDLLVVELDPKLGKVVVDEELALVWLPLVPKGLALLDMNGKTDVEFVAADCPELKGSFFSVVVLLKVGKLVLELELLKLGNSPAVDDGVAIGEVFGCTFGVPNTKGVEIVEVEVEVVEVLVLGDVDTEGNPAKVGVCVVPVDWVDEDEDVPKKGVEIEVVELVEVVVIVGVVTVPKENGDAFTPSALAVSLLVREVRNPGVASGVFVVVLATESEVLPKLMTGAGVVSVVVAVRLNEIPFFSVVFSESVEVLVSETLVSLDKFNFIPEDSVEEVDVVDPKLTVGRIDPEVPVRGGVVPKEKPVGATGVDPEVRVGVDPEVTVGVDPEVPVRVDPKEIGVDPKEIGAEAISSFFFSIVGGGK